MLKPKITIVVDNPDSWMNEYVPQFLAQLREAGYETKFVQTHDEIPKGGIAIFLSCEKKINEAIRRRSTHNLVVHESDLPTGKGWSPLTWQVLDGKNEIPICLFEAVESIDAGPIYEKGTIVLKGNELIAEMREKQVEKTMELIGRFLSKYPKVEPKEQRGKETFYKKRMPQDSELNPEHSIAEQFDILRITDNVRYPAYFHYKNRKYLVKIYRGD